MAPSLLVMRNTNGTSPKASNSSNVTFGDWRHNATPLAFITEGWSEGFMLGSLIIMACITVANMRKGVLLHKLILLELLLAMLHGTFAFMEFDGYGWYLSATAAPLYWSYFTHNVVAWIKIKPFFTIPSTHFRPWTCKWVAWIFISTLLLTIPITIFQIINNFRFFNRISTMYTLARPYESLFRDPWWLFSIFTLFHVIRTGYKFRVLQLIKKSPRFGILLVAIFLSMAFTCMDLLSIKIPKLSTTSGINPYWKLALVFKCLTDNIMLDDFKTTLKKLAALKLDAAGGPQPKDEVGSSSGNKSGAHDSENPWSQLNSRERHASISGRALDHDEILENSGRVRRKMPLAALGRVGTKLQALPSLPGTWRHSTSATQPVKEDVPLMGNITVISRGPPDERSSDEEQQPNSITMKTVISSGELHARPGQEEPNYATRRIYPGDHEGGSTDSSHITLVPKVSKYR